MNASARIQKEVPPVDKGLSSALKRVNAGEDAELDRALEAIKAVEPDLSFPDRMISEHLDHLDKRTNALNARIAELKETCDSANKAMMEACDRRNKARAELSELSIMRDDIDVARQMAGKVAGNG